MGTDRPLTSPGAAMHPSAIDVPPFDIAPAEVRWVSPVTGTVARRSAADAVRGFSAAVH